MPYSETFLTSEGAAPVAAVKMLNLEKLAAAEFHREPYEYLLVDDFLRDEYKTAIITDFPEIERHGSFPLSTLKYGPAFDQLASELFSRQFAEVVGRKFSLDLAQYPTMLTVRGWCDASDGQIHTDSTSKVITVLLYLNPQWSSEGGRLRLLRSKKLDDYVAEVAPTMGSVIIFKRSERSWHGHQPFEGKRMSLQFNWVNSSRYMRRERFRHKVSSFLKRLRGQTEYEG
jgi:SM-20-related protein